MEMLLTTVVKVKVLIRSRALIHLPDLEADPLRFTEVCHGKNRPIQVLSRGPNMAAIFGPRLNMAAKFGPRGPDVAAIFGPRTQFC